jgi:leucyl-tRNA synthetase
MCGILCCMSEGGGKYDHASVEAKWHKRWEEEKSYHTPDHKPGADNFFFLTEFPYPSGNLHVGHWYAFSVPDIFVRYMRMRGYNVLYPVGFDAFGLPAENAAIKNKVNPREWTFNNIDYMRGQLRSMGASFDWSREVITASPEYYQWTQWIFLQFYKKGLVYRKETAVNWCPTDKTVLANEQVVDGKCERCGSEVVQKMLPQWNIKITDYADRLIDDLAPLEWPKQIKDAQVNWIGRSEGALLKFQIANSKSQIEVFTTRPDTLFGATYVVLAPEHPLVESLRSQCINKDEILRYIVVAGKKTEIERITEGKEKTGVELKGVKAINPASKEELPIYVADYVLGNYGTGAIMAVPAHDERDYAFAQKFNLPVKQVIDPLYVQSTEPGVYRPEEPTLEKDGVIAIIKHWSEDKYLGIKWKTVAWGTWLTGGVEAGDTIEKTALKELREETGFTNAKFIKQLGIVYGLFYHVPKQKNQLVRGHIVYLELQDGAKEPVAAEEDAKHEIVWLTKDELKKFLTPDTHQHGLRLLDRGFEVYTGSGKLTNSGQFGGMDSEEAKRKITEFAGGTTTKQYHLRDWTVSRQRYWGVPIPMVHCEKCAAEGKNEGWQAVPDEQLPVVLPNVDDYLPRDDGKSPLAKATEWVNVPCPTCGGPAERETDTLDTFVDSSWYFLRYADPHNAEKFADTGKLDAWMPVNFYSGGSEHTTMHLLYSRFWHKAMYDLGLVAEPEPYLKRVNRGLIMGPDGQKMSKSKGNVIDPDTVVQELGADTVRMYLAFIGPYNEVGAYPWNPKGAVGVRRFLDRVWRFKPTESDKKNSVLGVAIKSVEESISSLKLNTGVAQLMTVLNSFEKDGASPREFATFVQLLAPYAPHIAHELSEMHDIDLTEWPTYNPVEVGNAPVKIAVQVDGKVRATLDLAVAVSQDEALALARQHPQVGKWLAAGEKKALYVPGKIISFSTR